MGWLVPIGAVLMMFGLGGSIAACYQGTAQRPIEAGTGAPGPTGGVPADANHTSIVPMVLAPLSGLALALGVGCIGVGAGRWQRPVPSNGRPANPFSEQPRDPPVGLV